MLYTGKFRSHQRNKEYTIQIITNNSSETQTEFVCGPSPFVTSMNTESATIYSPIKSSSATIEIVGNGYQYDLYSSTAKQNKVMLLDSSSNIIWTGYTQPNAYSVPFDYEVETYTVEALDGLGILQYYDYVPINGTKSFVTFKNIILKILRTADCYSNLYFPKNSVFMYNNQYDGYLGDIRNATISEQNFFNEDNEAMKMNEVLEEICKYCGVSCVADGQDVYLIDYDYVRKSYSESTRRDYIKINIASGNEENAVVFNTKQITSSDYSATNSTLTLDSTYSKVLVKDSLYTVDDVFPDIFNDDNLVNITDSSNYWNTMDVFEGSYLKVDKNGWAEFWGTKDKWEALYAASKWYKPTKGWKCNYYTNNGAATTAPSVMNGSVAKNYIGCTPARFHVKNSDNDCEDSGGITSALKELKKGTLNFENYLCFHQNRQSATNLCLLENNEVETPTIIFPKGTKLLLTGELLFSVCTYNNVYQCGSGTINVPYFPINADTGVSNEKFTGQGSSVYDHDFMIGSTKNQVKHYYRNGWYSYSISGDINFITLSIKVGDKYISSLSNPSWSNSEVKLSVPVTFNSDDILKSIVSNITVSDGIDEEGFCIRFPDFDGDCLAGKLKIRIYGFTPFLLGVGTSVVFLKGFNLKVKTPTVATTDERVTDTEYEFKINDAYVNELSDISFKICTWDNKQVNYSSPAYLHNGFYRFVDKVRFQGTNQIVRPEENFCYKIVQQYSTPSKKLTVTLFNDIKPYSLVIDTVIEQGTNTILIVDTVTYDYVNDSATYNLVEKK